MRSTNVILVLSGLLLLPGCYGKKTLRQPITIEEIATDVQEIRNNQVALSEEMRELEEQLASQSETVLQLQTENQTLYEQLGDRLTAIDNKLQEAIGRSSNYAPSRPYWSGDSSDGSSGSDSSADGSRVGGANPDDSTRADDTSGYNAASEPDRGTTEDGMDAAADASSDATSNDGSSGDGTRGDAASPGNAAGMPPEAQAKTIYEQAYLDLTRGNYPLAILGFTEFLRRTPDSELADNAQYWMGESYYAQKDYAQAILEFEKVVSRYGSGDKVPSALLKIGFSQISMGDKEGARSTLNDVTRRFPDSEESRLARDKLRSID